jgi:hypothetical protein
MKVSTLRVAALALCVLAVPVATVAAATPKPIPIPSPNLPKKALHSQMIVEVNKRGQVVRIKGGTLSHDAVFDTLTIGNALQMWIRKPNGSAQTGVYSVDYDYNPKTHNVSRRIALVSAGGNWANDSGAALKMVDAARRETAAAKARLEAEERQQQQNSAKHLPDINAALKRSLKSPTPSPHP